MESKIGIVKLSRKQLYDEIWLLSVAGVARKYNLNYGRLIGSCKEAGIPYPPSGYWTRKNLGKDVSSEIVPLKGDESLHVELATNDSVIKRIKKIKSEEDHIEKEQIKELSEKALPAVEENINYSKTAALEDTAKGKDNIPEIYGVLDYFRAG